MYLNSSYVLEARSQKPVSTSENISVNQIPCIYLFFYKCQNDYTQQCTYVDYGRNEHGPEGSLKDLLLEPQTPENYLYWTSGQAVYRGLLFILWLLGFPFTEASAGTCPRTQLKLPEL